MFPGQGAQYEGMGAELYRCEPSFREMVDECAELLKPDLGLDLSSVFYPREAGVPAGGQQINQTWLTQPALFVLEYALARLWMKWGVRPRAMIGHSVGEYVAACIAGVLALEDALRLIALRGRLMQQAPRGAMLAVPLSEQEVRPLTNASLSLAAINTTALCVASGSPKAVAALEQDLARRSVTCRRLPTSHAFHSAMMDAVVAPFVEQVERLSLHSFEIPYISNVTGGWITADQAVDPEYWGKHLRQTVRFADGLEALFEEPGRVLLEVGPGDTLTRLVKRHSRCPVEQIVLPSMRRQDGEVSDEHLLLKTLGQLWLNGVSVDWPQFYSHERRHRLPLPTYPFERQRYWVSLQDRPEAPRSAPVCTGKEPDISDWFYRPSWEAMPVLRSCKELETSQEKHCWVVFSDESGLGAALVARLRQEGQDAITALVGEGFSQVADGVFTLNAAEGADYRAFLHTLCAQGKRPTRIVHAWSVTNDIRTGSGQAVFRASQHKGFYSLLYLARAIRGESLTEPMQLWVVSSGLRKIESQDIAFPEKAPLLGACMVIPQESPNLICRIIDMVLSESTPESLARQADQIITEIAAGTSDSVVAYRGMQRWTQSFEPMRLNSADLSVRPLKEKGVYLITGGLGGVGLLIAEYLARNFEATVILTGRTNFPDRKDWEEWLATHGEEDRWCRKIRKLQALQELGAKIEVVKADVSDESAMHLLISRIYDEYGQLNGVLHAAGVTSGPSVYVPATDIDVGEAELQFEPKVYGLYVLEEVLRGRELDFCLLFSSNASTLGGIGLVAYSAANHFMDAFACHMSQRQGVPWISANWDPWPEETKKYEGVRTSVDQYAMTPHESWEAFRRVACIAPEGQIVVSTGGFYERLRQWVKPNPESAQAPVRGVPSLTPHSRPEMQIAYLAPRNETERLIADIWQQVLGVERVGVDDNFFDLGGHSLLLIQVQGALQETITREISMVSLFKYPTIGALAEYLTHDGLNEADIEPVQDRIEKQIEALNRKKELHKEQAGFSEQAGCTPEFAMSNPEARSDQHGQERASILRLLSELAGSGVEEDPL
jgi:acyl transferase domain-containing protein